MTNGLAGQIYYYSLNSGKTYHRMQTNQQQQQHKQQ